MKFLCLKFFSIPPTCLIEMTLLRPHLHLVLHSPCGDSHEDDTRDPKNPRISLYFQAVKYKDAPSKTVAASATRQNFRTTSSSSAGNSLLTPPSRTTRQTESGPELLNNFTGTTIILFLVAYEWKFGAYPTMRNIIVRPSRTSITVSGISGCGNYEWLRVELA
jgi:hypothetical protein